jgi:nucleotide-binding universal stress UspA family protein
VNHLIAQHEDTRADVKAGIPSAVVVPIDGGARAERALGIGARWATEFGADLVVLTVEGDQKRAELAETVEAVGVSTATWREFDERYGIVPAVLDATVADPTAVVCVATNARSPLVDVTHDDIAQQILRAVEVPMMLVGPHCCADVADGPVVVADDGSPEGQAVLEHARAWATALRRPLTLLHVRQPLSPEPADAPSTLREARDRMGSDAMFEIVSHTFPAGAIRDYAHEVDASLLALSTRGRTDTLTASTGRTATWVVRESPCPVLVAHPPASSKL